MPTFLEPSEPFPPALLPTAFADGVMNLSHSPSVVKFYLFRTDPGVKDVNAYIHQPFAQVIMPLQAFVQTATFFERGLERLISLGYITPEQVAAARASHVQAEQTNV